MLNKIKFSYKQTDKQDNNFTAYHTRFKCKIKVDGLQYTFPYQCNTEHMMPNLMDCLSCLISDKFAYEDSRDLIDFCNEFGYLERAGVDAYKACKKTAKALNRLFTEEELEEIQKELEEEGY